MVSSYHKYELFGEAIIEKIVLEPPFEMNIPMGEYACFMYLIEGLIVLKSPDDEENIPAKDSLLLNCRNFTKKVSSKAEIKKNAVILIHFLPHVIKKVYQNELPAVLQRPQNPVTNLSNEQICNDFLIQKYIESLLFYFENPLLVNEDILILKLKEIILLLSQTRNADGIRKIFSQVFSPTSYTFKQVIEANLYSEISVEALAKECNLSLSTFKREFARQFDATPANYLKNKRLEKAAELLLLSTERITDIAFDCGFGDVTNFSKSFYEKYQVSPSNYRLNQITK